MMLGKGGGKSQQYLLVIFNVVDTSLPNQKDKTRVHTHAHTSYSCVLDNLLEIIPNAEKRTKKSSYVVAISLLASFSCRLCVWAHSHGLIPMHTLNIWE